MRLVSACLPCALLLGLAGCHQGLLTGPVDTPSYVEAMLGQWDYASAFSFERAHAAGDTLHCTITGMVLHVTEPIGHDDGFLSSAFETDASVEGGTMSCTGAAIFSVSIDEGIRKASARSSALDLEFRINVLTPIGLLTVLNIAWREGQVAGDLVTQNAWAGRVWASDDVSRGGPPFAPGGNFDTTRR